MNTMLLDGAAGALLALANAADDAALVKLLAAAANEHIAACKKASAWIDAAMPVAQFNAHRLEVRRRYFDARRRVDHIEDLLAKERSGRAQVAVCESLERQLHEVQEVRRSAESDFEYMEELGG